MNVIARLSLFGALLLAIFAGAALAGDAVDPSGPEAGEHGGGHAEPAGRGGYATAALPGLQVAQEVHE